MQNHPTHILVECPEYIVSASLGVVGCLAPLERAGLCEIRFMRTLSIKSKDIVWADILVTVRGCEPPTVSVVNAARKAGRLIAYYLDDDLLHIPSESLAHEYYEDPIITEGMRKILANTDVLWGVNPNIRDEYLSLTKGRWIQNRVHKSIKRTVPELSEDVPIKILYAGSVDHQVIVRELLSPAIEQLCSEYGDRIRATFIGPDPGLKKLKNVSYFPFISPYEAYEKFVCEGDYSIGLAPGRKEPFYGCKYYNKYLEYSSIGAVGVYTNAEPYTQVIQNRVNGLLCENTASGWYDAIKELIEDRTLLRACATRAAEDLQERFNETIVTDEFLQQFPEIGAFHAPEVSINSVHLVNGYFVFYAERAKLLWRQKGIAGIPVIMWRTAKFLVKHGSKGVVHTVQRVFQRDN